MKTAEKKEPYAKIEEHDRSMNDNKKKRFHIIRWLVFLLLLAVAAAYIMDYYPADAVALRAMTTDTDVTVKQTDYGWIFDGPSEENALIFYPGGKVDEKAYAPLLHRLAKEGMDVCLVRMPCRLAFLGVDKAEDVMEQYHYANWYIGGHSLGGAMAARFAADHGDRLTGVILLAAYPTKKLSSNLKTLVLYGSADGVINKDRLWNSKKYLPSGTRIQIMNDGNHANFGNYGKQKGDGLTALRPEEQQKQTIEKIKQLIAA
jgi:hypothetical protein